MLFNWLVLTVFGVSLGETGFAAQVTTSLAYAMKVLSTSEGFVASG